MKPLMKNQKRRVVNIILMALWMLVPMIVGLMVLGIIILNATKEGYAPDEFEKVLSAGSVTNILLLGIMAALMFIGHGLSDVSQKMWKE